jgi:hypothetical protein
MRTIKFDDDPKKNQQLLDYVNDLIKQNGIDNSIKNTRKLLFESEERKKQHIKNNTPLYNIESHIKLCKNMLEYLDEVKVETRDKKLKSLLGEKKILNFNNFKLIN